MADSLWGLYKTKCPLWGPMIYTGRTVSFTIKKTEGSWDVWSTVMKSSAQFQAPWINLGMCFHIWGKGIQQSNQQGHMQWKMTEVASVDKPSSPFQPVSRKSHGISEGSPVCSQPIILPPPFAFPSLSSTTCTLSGTKSLRGDFFLIIRAKWAAPEC